MTMQLLSFSTVSAARPSGRYGNRWVHSDAEIMPAMASKGAVADAARSLGLSHRGFARRVEILGIDWRDRETA